MEKIQPNRDLGAESENSSALSAQTVCVVFNADDFGANEKVNSAIRQAHADGILTSASLMVNESGAADAVELARELPDLSVGLHVVCSDGRAALPQRNIPHLVDANGNFPRDPAVSGIRAFFSSAVRREIRCEIEAQFARYERTGLELTHVNGHQHLHVHPVIWDTVVRLSAAQGTPVIRIPYEEFAPYSAGRIRARRMEWLFFRALRRRCVRSARENGLYIMDRVYGHLETGQMTSSYILFLLERISSHFNEIYFHPGTAHAKPMEGRADRDVELDGLLDPRMRERLNELGIRRISFRDRGGR